MRKARKFSGSRVCFCWSSSSCRIQSLTRARVWEKGRSSCCSPAAVNSLFFLIYSCKFLQCQTLKAPPAPPSRFITFLSTPTLYFLSQSFPSLLQGGGERIWFSLHHSLTLSSQLCSWLVYKNFLTVSALLCP